MNFHEARQTEIGSLRQRAQEKKEFGQDKEGERNVVGRGRKWERDGENFVVMFLQLYLQLIVNLLKTNFFKIIESV